MNEERPEVSRLLREIMMKQRARGDEFVRQTGLSVQAAHTIGWIDAHGDAGVIQREIAEFSGTTAASVASLVKGLEAGGYVERRPDPHDSRSKRVHLLPRAKAMMSDFQSMADQAENDLLASLTLDEQRTFVRLLAKVSSGLD